MSYAENRKTVEDFVPGLKSTESKMRLEHIVSVYKETHRLADNWPYYIDDAGIYVETKGSKVYVKDIVKGSSYPESAEKKVLEDVEAWAQKNESGISVWISPDYQGKYPCSKIIFHQISYEFGSLRKIIQSSAILFDSNEAQTLNFLHQNFPHTTSLDKLEQYRSVLITSPVDIDINKILVNLKALDKNTLPETETLSTQEIYKRAAYISFLVESGQNGRFIAYEMQRLNLLGQFSISCPSSSITLGTLSFSEISSQTSELLDRSWHVGTCRVCGQVALVGGCDICDPCVKQYFS